MIRCTDTQARDNGAGIAGGCRGLTACAPPASLVSPGQRTGRPGHHAGASRRTRKERHAMEWVLLGIIVVLIGWLVVVYNRPGHAAPGHRPVLVRCGCAAEAAPRPDPEPGRDGEGLCRAREDHARCRDPGAQQCRQRPGAGPGGGRAGGRRSWARALGRLFALSRGLSGPQGQPELPVPAGRAVGHREQDRRRAALLQLRRSPNTTP